MSKEAEPGPKPPSRFNIEAINSAVQAIAIVGAGAWAVYTFIYQAKIAPGLAPPSVSVANALERVGRKGDLVAIRSTVTRTNVGQTGVRVLALTYNVIGIKVRFVETAAADRMSGSVSGSSAVAEARYYDEPENGEVILRYGVLFEGAAAPSNRTSDLNPGEAVSRDLIFYADPTKFDSIRFVVGLSYAKLSEPPMPLALGIGRDGRISAVPDPGCRAEPSRCKAPMTTDFGTEFSLW